MQIQGMSGFIDGLDFKQCRALFTYLKLIITFDDQSKQRINSRLRSMLEFRSRIGLVNRLTRDEQLEIIKIFNKSRVTVEDCEKEFFSSKINTKPETCHYYFLEMFDTFQDASPEENEKYREVAKTIYLASRRLYEISLYLKTDSRDPDYYIIPAVKNYDKWLLASYMKRVIPSMILDKAQIINEDRYIWCRHEHLRMTQNIRSNKKYFEKNLKFMHFFSRISKIKGMRKIIYKMIKQSLFHKLFQILRKTSNEEGDVSTEDINYIFSMLFLNEQISFAMDDINTVTKKYFETLGMKWNKIRFEEVVFSVKTVNMDTTKIRNVVLTAIEKIQTILLLIAPFGILLFLNQFFVGIVNWIVVTVLTCLSGWGFVTFINFLKFINKSHGAYKDLKFMISEKFEKDVKSDNQIYGYSSDEWVNWFKQKINKLIDEQLRLEISRSNIEV